MTQAKQRVLIIDDDEIDRENIRRILRHHYDVSEAATGEAGLEQVSDHHCVLIDYRLPDYNGIDLIESVASEGAAVIMLTGRGSENIAVEAMRRGCTDYLVKGAFEASDLIRSIGHAITSAALRREVDQQRQNLRQHADELERMNSMLQQFVHAASHDLQEPLRTIAGFADLLRERLENHLDKEGYDWLNRIILASTRMSELINNLKTYTKLEASEQRFERVPLNEIMRLAADNLQRVLEENNGQIHCDDLPTVSGDPTQLLQLFQNLIGNAIKFARPDRPAEVRIEAMQHEDRWDVSVADNGIGIDPTHHTKIFEMFCRLHPTSRYPGTGMGLALSHRIAERHRGEITVESALGEGCVFHVLLPAAAHA